MTKLHDESPRFARNDGEHFTRNDGMGTLTKLHQLAELGQAIWLDYIRRHLITSGDLQTLVDEGLRGVTSNPTIFEKAIAGSTDYDEALRRLVDEAKTVSEIYEALALDDIQRTADILRPVYEQTGGADGYVSLEVNPNLAHDTNGTIAEARRLFAALGRPNVMIKVPATPAGIPAIETLIGEGINVNVTLIFSLAHYEVVAEAYLAGLEEYAAAGGDVSQVASVASFFVSRVDTAVDRALEERGETSLQGKIAVANSKLAYARFKKIFSGERWDRLAALGGRVQRVLWASTSTKNPLYPDTWYVDSLIGPHTVNTVPPATLNAYRDHGTVASTLDVGLAEAKAQLRFLASLGMTEGAAPGMTGGATLGMADGSAAGLGVDLDAITQQLQDDGVAKFAQSFESLMATIAEKRDRLLAGWQGQEAHLGAYQALRLPRLRSGQVRSGQALVDTAVAEMREERILPRIWAHDHTVWKSEPTEITNRLGWLHIAEAMIENVPRLEKLTEDARAAGYTHVLLLGMGGSSLASQVFRKTFGVRDGYLDLAVLDSTDPGAVLAYAEELDPARTLFIVATKSGTTAETLSFFKYFYNRTIEAVSAAQAGEHFVAITDPGTNLVDLAERYDFRATFLNDPNIGGRYSALSYFGLVSAALVGVDVPLLLDRAMSVTCGSESCVALADNPGARLGAILGELAKAGRDKATFAISPDIVSFGDWVEQLIAESTGKEGTGILPVVREPLGPLEVYGNDRLFIHLRMEGDATHDAAMAALEEAGHPVVRVNLRDRYDLGGQFFLWEIATAVAGHRLDINPFDQPDVEAAKGLARQMIAEYAESGTLPSVEPAILTGEALHEFLAQEIPGFPSTLLRAGARNDGVVYAQPGDPEGGAGRSYVTLQAYVQPTPRTDEALAALRLRLRDRTQLATTAGYGPRFLHSTGQLHKGDAGRGLFIQLTADDTRDVPIPNKAGEPDSSITFGVLKMAQALGDRRALLDAGRRVIRFHLGEDVVGGLKRLTEALA
jgi:transaldolase/glucose-6-phosphate isomerase